MNEVDIEYFRMKKVAIQTVITIGTKFWGCFCQKPDPSTHLGKCLQNSPGWVPTHTLQTNFSSKPVLKAVQVWTNNSITPIEYIASEMLSI